MLKAQQRMSEKSDPKKRSQQSPLGKRALSTNRIANTPKAPVRDESVDLTSAEPRTSEKMISKNRIGSLSNVKYQETLTKEEKNVELNSCAIMKLTRSLNIKRMDFINMRKELIDNQNQLLEVYAMIRELESRVGVSNEESAALGDVLIFSVAQWPAHDLLLLLRDNCKKLKTAGSLGEQVMEKMQEQLGPIPDEVMTVCTELLTRRTEMLTVMRNKHRNGTSLSNLEWKTKHYETEKLQKTVDELGGNLKTKIDNALELSKIAWLDRESLIKKVERYLNEKVMLQHDLDNNCATCKDFVGQNKTNDPSYQELMKELEKERKARVALKSVVSNADETILMARGRINQLEKQLKETKMTLETMQTKHRELEKEYRRRETSYDYRSKRLEEMSKTGELTVEVLSKQRDALEQRVKELREAVARDKEASKAQQAEFESRMDNFRKKFAEEVKKKEAAEQRVSELENKLGSLEGTVDLLRKRSSKLIDTEKSRCLQYLPRKENEPTDRETEIWKELVLTREALANAQQELKLSRDDKENFLNMLAKIAEEAGPENIQGKFATELLDKEKKIQQMQGIIDTLRENENRMSNIITKYKNQLSTLRMKVFEKHLQSRDCFLREIKYSEEELLELHKQVESLKRERKALVSAATARALMLERYERSTSLFARLTRARRDLAAVIEGRPDPPSVGLTKAEFTQSLTTMCARSSKSWSALQMERGRVLTLERAVLAQSIQLQREGCVRTQLEHRRAILERELLMRGLQFHPNRVIASPQTSYQCAVPCNDIRNQVVPFHASFLPR